jgi:hypothetical protein
VNTQTTLLRQLEAYIQEEIGAQQRLLALLGSQERALVAGVPAEIAAATQKLERELHALPQRARRRSELLDALAKTWNVAPRALTLASVIERVGDDGDRLRRQRSELRNCAGQVARATRRNAFNARAQERVNGEMLQAVLAAGSNAPLATSGALVDAEA